MKKDLKLEIEAIEEKETKSQEAVGHFESNQEGGVRLYKNLYNAIDAVNTLAEKFNDTKLMARKGEPIKMQVHELYKIASDAACELVEFMALCHKFLNSPNCK